MTSPSLDIDTGAILNLSNLAKTLMSPTGTLTNPGSLNITKDLTVGNQICIDDMCMKKSDFIALLDYTKSGKLGKITTGDITAGNITCGNVNASTINAIGNVNAKDVNIKDPYGNYTSLANHKHLNTYIETDRSWGNAATSKIYYGSAKYGFRDNDYASNRTEVL